uniref:Uncharacterized protein n=1 Tax=Oryza brachyantha TaxID=4533 RepID=J3N800_ORYBR
MPAAGGRRVVPVAWAANCVVSTATFPLPTTEALGSASSRTTRRSWTSHTTCNGRVTPTDRPCHGLVLLSSIAAHLYFVCNPTFGQVTALCDGCMAGYPQLWYDYATIGLSYDVCTCMHKAVRLLYHHGEPEGCDVYHITGANSTGHWRQEIESNMNALNSRKKKNKTRPSNLQLQLAKTAPHHRHSRRRTEPYFNLRNNLLQTQALALALVGEKLSKAEYKPPYSTSNTQERENNECNKVSRIG